MNTFIKNINEYLKYNRIKRTYISMITGWDKSRVSRLLNGEVDIRMDDAEQLAKALGKDLTFFSNEQKQFSQFVSYTSYLNKKDKLLAKDILDIFRYYDSLVDLDK